MTNRGKKNLLGVKINAIDYNAAVSQVITAARAKNCLTVSALAVHGVMTGVLDLTHRYRLNQLDLVVPDGQPVRWALNWLYGCRLQDRVYGPALMMKVCEEATKNNLSIYLYGSSTHVLDILSHNLHAHFPELKISGLQPSQYRQISTTEKQTIINQIVNSGANIVFVGLGCPRQEVWIYEHRHVFSMPLLAVGAAFDFHAGLLPQAPSFLQKTGLEWLYRLIQEPGRLWKRYLLLNPLFIFLLILQALKLKRFDPDLAQAPTQEIRYG